MRTTLTLDDDVAKEMERVRKERGSKWRALVNEALRLGLIQMQKKSTSSMVPPTEPKSLGRCIVGDIVSVSDALALGEDEAFH